MKFVLCVKLCQHDFTIVIVHKLPVHGHCSESGLHSLPSRSSRCPRPTTLLLTLVVEKRIFGALEQSNSVCNKLFFCQNDSPIGGTFWKKDSLLQYTITLLQGPKDTALPTLTYTPDFQSFLRSWQPLLGS